uniref:Nuclear nucleic acid-binding protein C1D n=1 Tax=Steinernema glaseri TaxID=37863 RepID=A0A1I7Y0W7_9BILA
MSGMPEEVLLQLTKLIESIDRVEKAVEDLSSISEPTDRTTIESARMELSALFSLNTLFWANERLDGRDPAANEELMAELKRTKEYMKRLKEVDDMENRPKVNQKVASALLRNAMFDVDEENKKRSEKLDQEKSA